MNPPPNYLAQTAARADRTTTDSNSGNRLPEDKDQPIKTHTRPPDLREESAALPLPSPANIASSRDLDLTRSAPALRRAPSTRDDRAPSASAPAVVPPAVAKKMRGLPRAD